MFQAFPTEGFQWLFQCYGPVWASTEDHGCTLESKAFLVNRLPQFLQGDVVGGGIDSFIMSMEYNKYDAL